MVDVVVVVVVVVELVVVVVVTVLGGAAVSGRDDPHAATATSTTTLARSSSDLMAASSVRDGRLTRAVRHRRGEGNFDPVGPGPRSPNWWQEAQMTTQDEVDQTQRGIEQLVRMATEAATGLDEVVDCARAASWLDSVELLELVAGRVAQEVENALASSGAWEAELTYSKLDAWEQTGRKAHLLAEAWGYVAPGLRRAMEAAEVSVPRGPRAG